MVPTIITDKCSSEVASTSHESRKQNHEVFQVMSQRRSYKIISSPDLSLVFIFLLRLYILWKHILFPLRKPQYASS
jgi:hypothetical protein